MLITDFILCYDHYRLLHPFDDPSLSKASRWSASRVGHNRRQLYLDCQAFLDFQREIYLCGSVRWTQLRVSPVSAGGLWKNLVSATNLPSWMRSTHTHTHSWASPRRLAPKATDARNRMHWTWCGWREAPRLFMHDDYSFRGQYSKRTFAPVHRGMSNESLCGAMPHFGRKGSWRARFHLCIDD